MLKLIDLLLTFLSTYRLTKLIIDDEIMSDVREVVFEKFNPSTSKIGYLFTCPWCMSIWAAVGIVLIDKISPETGRTLKTVLSASAATGIISTQIY